MADYLQGGHGNNRSYPRVADALRIPLVVRILRRQDDRLGRPPRRHRPVGHRHGQQRPAQRSKATAEHPVPLQGRLADGRRTGTTRRRSSTSSAKFPNERRAAHPSATARTASLFEGDEGRRSSSAAATCDGKAGRRRLEGQAAARGRDHASSTRARSPATTWATSSSACKDRAQPICDVSTHHRAMTTCHLANIAIRLGRKLKWDAANRADRRRRRSQRVAEARAAEGVRDRGVRYDASKRRRDLPHCICGGRA